MEGRSFAFSQDQPGVMYRVITCSDLSGDTTNKNASALYLELLVMYQPGIIESRRNTEDKNSITYDVLVQRLPKIFQYFRDLNDGVRDPKDWKVTTARF